MLKALDAAIKALKSSRKKGKWVRSFYSEGDRAIYKCSECGRYLEFTKGQDELKNYPFCHCGAKMEGDGE